MTDKKIVVRVAKDIAELEEACNVLYDAGYFIVNIIAKEPVYGPTSFIVIAVRTKEHKQ